MRLLFFGLFLLFSFVRIGLSQEGAICTHCSGFKVFGKQTIPNIQVQEDVHLIGTTITESMTITGHLYSEDALIKKLEIIGKASLMNTQVMGSSTVFGAFAAFDSSFRQTLTLNTHKAVFNNCQMQNLVIKNSPSENPVLELKKGTIIQGSVIFESGQGIIHLDSTSKILGLINNGKIQN